MEQEDHRITAGCLKARGEIDGAPPFVPGNASVGDPAPQHDAACRALCDRHESGQGSRWVGLRRRSQVREREPEPSTCVGVPDALPMSAGIKPKDVRDPRREELPMQLEILRPEASVSTTDVETEEGRLSVESVPKPVNGVVQVRP